MRTSSGGSPTSTSAPSVREISSSAAPATMIPAAAEAPTPITMTISPTREASEVAMLSRLPARRPSAAPPRGCRMRRVIASRSSCAAVSEPRSVMRSPKRYDSDRIANVATSTPSQMPSAASSPGTIARSIVAPTTIGTIASPA